MMDLEENLAMQLLVQKIFYTTVNLKWILQNELFLTDC